MYMALFAAKTVMSLAGGQILKNTSTSIYDTIRSIYSHKNVDVERKLKELEIENKIQVVESLIIEIKDCRSKTVEKAIENLNNSLENVHYHLDVIDCRIRKHKNKWFSSYRSLNIDKELDEIERLSVSVDSNLNLLQNVIIIFNSVNNITSPHVLEKLEKITESNTKNLYEINKILLKNDEN